MLLQPHSHEKPKQSAAAWRELGGGPLQHAASTGCRTAIRGRSAGVAAHKLIVLPIYVGLLAGTVWIGRHGAERLHPEPRPGLRHRRRRSFPTAPRSRARTRSCSGPRRSCARRPACRTPSPSPASPARPSPTPRTPRRSSPASSPSTSASSRRPVGRFDHRRAVRPHAADRGRLHHRHSAAAGAGPRQFRRLQDAAPGAHRRRGRPRARGRLRDRWPARAQNPNLTGVFTTFSANSPQIYLEIDRDEGAHPQRADRRTSSRRCRSISAPPTSTTSTSSAGSGRSGRRPTSASASSRATSTSLRVRSSTGALVPLGTLVEMRDVTGPDLIQRYNMYTSVPLQGNAAPGISSGTGPRRDGGARPRRCCRRARRSSGPTSPSRSAQTGNTAIFIFALSRPVRLPRARGAIRELVAAARDHPDRADGGAVGACSA